ncbi:MAG: ABC transporter permease subunit [Devosia sp.]
MLRYVIRRISAMLPVAFVAITTCFFIIRLAPGGPFDRERTLPPTIKANMLAAYDMDQPLWVQYFRYIGRLLHGDLGPSMVNQTFSVNEMIALGFPFTATLGLSAFVLATTAGILAGTISALNQNKWPDYLLVLFVMVGVVVPNFLTAHLMQLVFGVYLRWLPAAGYSPGSLLHLIMPVIVLGLAHAARVSRLMRGSMIEVLGTNYVRTARAKGLGERLVIARHALRPALMPVVSYLGPGLSYLLTGSLVVEQVFGLPGIGKYFISAALNRDYGLVLGTVILYIFIILVLNLLVDLVYALLDPKVRYS